MIERQPAEMTGAELLDEALLLSEQRAQPFYTEARRAQISRRMAQVIFEIRYQDGQFNTELSSHEAVSQ